MAAVNHMSHDPEGFFLHVEGGAVDWADHEDDSARLLEEHVAFNETAAEIIRYLENNTDGNNFGNTLLIITSDHDHLTYGPQSGDAAFAFQDVEDRGAGVMPGVFHNYDGHAASLVPTYVRGLGAGDLLATATDYDPYLDAFYNHQVDIGQYLNGVREGFPIPEPTGIAVLGVAGLMLRRRR